MTTLSDLEPGSVAVVTGGASGIGLAAARAYLARGLKVCIVDLGTDRLAAALDGLSPVAASGPEHVIGIEADVSRLEELQRVDEQVRTRWGGVDLLMNNAGIQPGSSILGPVETWRRVVDVNLWGPIYGIQAIVPGMIARGRPGLVINTGSKQGITTPPGEPAYNVSKAGLKVVTEQLQHELRNKSDCRITAHLLIPGFVFTSLTAYGRTEKPAGAWTPEQTVSFMIHRLDAGDFYILCPDNEVSRKLDEMRIAWAADDIVQNRPPLSRWHPDFREAFADYCRKSE